MGWVKVLKRKLWYDWYMKKSNNKVSQHKAKRALSNKKRIQKNSNEKSSYSTKVLDMNHTF